MQWGCVKIGMVFSGYICRGFYFCNFVQTQERRRRQRGLAAGWDLYADVCRWLCCFYIQRLTARFLIIYGLCPAWFWPWGIWQWWPWEWPLLCGWRFLFIKKSLWYLAGLYWEVFCLCADQWLALNFFDASGLWAGCGCRFLWIFGARSYTFFENEALIAVERTYASYGAIDLSGELVINYEALSSDYLADAEGNVIIPPNRWMITFGEDQNYIKVDS